ncbi:hypothetical protein [Nocardia sp. NPDC047038]|uniref:hypothetical protein n=1 Tax=Nocardia sp. NPDC047038 TaxID=3154338 RepID=UPI0033C77656
MPMMLLSGCGLLPHTHPEKEITPESSHSIQELCDFPRQFFATRYDANKIEVSVDATKPMTEKISFGNGCSYRTSDQNYLGYVSLLHSADAITSPQQVEHSSRTLTVDGVRVTEIAKPIPDYADPATARPWFELIADIDGWEGKLGFKNGDDQGTQVGARLLVDMIRKLKG